MTEQLHIIDDSAFARLTEGERQIWSARHSETGLIPYKEVGSMVGRMSATTARKAVLEVESKLRCMTQGPHSSQNSPQTE